MTIHSEIGDCEDPEAINEFAEPCQEFSGDESFTDEVLSSDDLEIVSYWYFWQTKALV